MWVRHDKQTVLRRLAEGATIQTIVPRADGALDELVALSAELGTFTMLDALAGARERRGIPDPSCCTPSPCSPSWPMARSWAAPTPC